MQIIKLVFWQCCVPHPGSEFFPSRIPGQKYSRSRTRIRIKEFIRIRIKEFRYLLPKKLFLNSRIRIRHTAFWDE
jgi:hypothetical protein